MVTIADVINRIGEIPMSMVETFVEVAALIWIVGLLVTSVGIWILDRREK